MKTKRAFRYRFYPTPEQEATLARTFGCVRYVYNWALGLRQTAYRESHENLSCGDTSAALTVLKRQPETAWLSEVSSVPLQQTLRHLNRAFQNFLAGLLIPASRPGGGGKPQSSPALAFGGWTASSTSRRWSSPSIFAGAATSAVSLPR